MNQQMYRQAITQQNLIALSARGIHFVGPNSGFQACGDVGAGRMSEPAEIFESLQSLFAVYQDLADLSVTITAGPTREAIDPVRYILITAPVKWALQLLKPLQNVGQMSP